MRCVVFGFLVLLLTPMASVQAAVYVGFGLGNGDLSGAIGAMLDDGSFSTLEQDDRDLYSELIVGLRLSPRTCLELAQQKIGSFSAHGTSDGSALYAAGGVSAEADIELSKLSLQANLFGNGRVSGYLRLGLQQSKLRQAVSAYSAETHSGSGALYGLGIGLIANRHWQLQLEMNRYHGLAYRDPLTAQTASLAINTLGGRALYLF